MRRSLIAILFIAFAAFAAAPPPARAEDPKKPAQKQQTGKTSPKVLDFDGDVIEGQKKTPELFLQTEVERPTLDTVLYQRKNFNDFHGSDSKRRPRASDPPHR